MSDSTDVHRIGSDESSYSQNAMAAMLDLATPQPNYER